MSDLTDAQRLAIEDAAHLARRIGHAAAVVMHEKANGRGEDYKAADSWKPMERGWEVVWLVSSTGKVVRQ